MPHQKIAVDESTVGYKGRIFFKTYNPQKPTKWGLRVFVLAECKTGYTGYLKSKYTLSIFICFSGTHHRAFISSENIVWISSKI